MSASDLAGTIVAKAQLVINDAADGVEMIAQKIGDRFNAVETLSVTSGQSAATLATVSVPAQPFDWRPTVAGYAKVKGTGVGNVVVDLLARLNDASGGNIVGKGVQQHSGLAGLLMPTYVLVPGPPAGSSDDYDKVSAGDDATIYLRAEKQSGSDFFVIAASDVHFNVTVSPIP
ncbi:Uncharacterised protein [Mycobacterium tuberculosis]|nr:Uncharacterised protein [Mycobacterium tuberculosis]